MILKRIENTATPLFGEAMALYREAFPAVERRDEDEHARVMQKSDYHLDVMTEDGAFVGIAMYWETEAFLFLEHLATLPHLRGQGYGAETLACLKGKGKPVILEIEPPVDVLTRRRRAFYERNGFAMNEHYHLQTKFRPHDEDLELKILSYPRAVTAEEYGQFYAYLDREVACVPRLGGK